MTYMKYIQYILTACLLLMLGTSCENDGFYYQDEARIRMEGPEEWTLETDSLLFSFVTSPETVTEQTMNVTLYVMGLTTDYDRTANVEVVTDQTTASSDLYEVPAKVTIPAGENQGSCPVVLKRSALLQNTTVRLYIRVAASEDFAVGNIEQSHLLLKWNDILSEPTNWNELKEFFGTYSDAKYRFMLSYAGVSEFDTEAMTWAELNNYKITLTNAYNEYRTTNPPILDENTGLEISFDN